MTQMLLEKPSSCGRSRSPSRIGSISTKPCSTGTATAGQRFCNVLRRSDHNSAAVSAAYTATMPAPIVRRIADACGASAMTAATQAIAPNSSPGRLGLRPWNTRAAFQTMPQATKPTALSASEYIAPSVELASVQTATDAAPSR